MAATRKLQGEIDRCLKKVTEGVETFEDIWKKVHNATNSNQKEKYEADLKKEIKKLQRLRDQIKSWIASGEIKDKSLLMDYRKLIETQMERFKVVERETKTKAYSKEGLGAAQKLDPAQKEKEEVSSWLIACIHSLNLQVDSYESEVESIMANKKKKLDKDKQERVDELKSKLEKHRFHTRKLETLLRMLDNMSVEVEQIKNIKDDVEYYVESSQDPDFEENEYIYDDIIGLDEVELSGVVIPSSGTTDSNETGGTPTSVISGSSPIPSPLLNSNGTVYNHSGDGLIDDAKKMQQLKDTPIKPIKPTAVRAAVGAAIGTPPGTVGSATTVTPPGAVTTPNGKSSSATSLASVTPNKQTPSLRDESPQTVSTPSGNFAAVAANGAIIVAVGKQVGSIAAGDAVAVSTSVIASAGTATSMSTPSNTPPNVNPVVLPYNTQQPQPFHHSMPALQIQTINASVQSKLGSFNADHLVQNNCPSPVSSVSSRTSPIQSLEPCIVIGNSNQKLQQLQQVQQQQQIQLSQQAHLNGPGVIETDQLGEGMSSLRSIAQQAIDRAGLDPVAPPSVVPPPSSGLDPSVVHKSSSSQLPLPQQQQQQGQQAQQQPISAVSVPSQQPAPPQTTAPTGVMTPGAAKSEALIPPLLGVAPLGAVPLQKEHQGQFKMMESAYYHMPHPSDSERLRTYLPRNPVQTPMHYPQSPLPHSDTLEFYQRFATETLFFVFYYMEGTKAQYLAAKALKKQSWRFHTKYMMWFQRHEEPKIINEEYEQGTYIYFDYEKWSQRKKEGFTFEYKYLEDRDLN